MKSTYILTISDENGSSSIFRVNERQKRLVETINELKWFNKETKVTVNIREEEDKLLDFS